MARDLISHIAIGDNIDSVDMMNHILNNRIAKFEFKLYMQMNYLKYKGWQTIQSIEEELKSDNIIGISE